MRKLAALLTDVSPAEREEAIQYYNDYFDDAGAENEQSRLPTVSVYPAFLLHFPVLRHSYRCFDNFPAVR